jgi:hypothetical protein
VPGGQEADARLLAGDVVVDVVGQFRHAAQPDSVLRHRGGRGGRDRALVDADVVAVRVADDAERSRVAAVEVDPGAADLEVV